MKFISPNVRVGYVRALDKFLDIEYSDDFDYIKKSNKALLVWNYYANLVSKDVRWQLNNEIWKWYRQNKLPSYCIERGALPNTCFIDKGGFNVDSDSYGEKNWNTPLNNEQLKKIDTYIKQFTIDSSTLDPQGSNRISQGEFLNKLKVKPNQKIIFVPLQVPWDTTIKLWVDWVKSVEKFNHIIYTIALDNPNLLFLIKPHPKGRIGISKVSNIRNVDIYHYKDCLEVCDKVITINSGVGLQAMIWKKTVIIVGKSFYQFKNINYKANNLDDLIRLISVAKKPDFTKVRRFIYFLKYRFYSDIDTEKIKFKTVRIYPNED